MDYSIYFKEEVFANDSWTCSLDFDYFFSAYNASERVQKIHELVKSDKKYWLIFPEYQLDDNEVNNLPDTIECSGSSEGEQILSLFDCVDISKLQDKSIGVDITGFPRAQLAFFIKYLKLQNISNIEVYYGEPMQYKDKENTKFSDDSLIESPRQVNGFEGTHERDQSNDLMIIGAGYDHHLISGVVNEKQNVKSKLLIGFPSLRPDMYQENIYRASLAQDSVTAHAFNNPIFAPANDPFITAQILSDTINKLTSQNEITNLYLCPLSTKCQTLGFILYYLAEMDNKNCSMIFPFISSYEKETSVGLYKVWRYEIQLEDLIR